jgi:hypothetical protein
VIGRKIGDTIFLLPKMTLSELERLKIFSQAPSVASLGKELNDRGLLKLNDKPHIQSKQTVGGHRVRGWWLGNGWDEFSHPKKSEWDAKNDNFGHDVPTDPLVPVKINHRNKPEQTVMIKEGNKENGNINGTNGTVGRGKEEGVVVDSIIPYI